MASGRSLQLLATKLFAPRLPAGFVPRPRLLERLDAGLAGGLMLVSAPAGYGKTALVAEWARQRAVGWLSLDPADNDPTRFWRHVLAALDGVRPGTAQRVEPALGPPTPTSLEEPLTALINDLANESDPTPIVLALDDYQVIDAAAVHESLTFLVEHRPPQLHLVVLSRADPALPLARLRATGQLAEVRADDLRFSVDETQTLLRTALQLSLREATAAALTARTEGWAAGLRLASLSLQGRSDADDFVQAFSGSHRYVLDYLTEEVLERQAEPVRRFLLETSVLERLTGSLCDAVTGRRDGRAMLDTIERANLFVVPLDDVREWWRYHHLFADLLRGRLHHEWPERVPELHANAADWYERRGFVEDAISHALQARDADRAARLVEQQVDEFLLRNEEATLERWLAALPADVRAARPRLQVAQADLALSRGNLQAAERALDTAERAAATAPREPYEPSVGNSASLVANVPAAVAFWRAYIAELHGDTEQANSLDRRALTELGDDQSALASVVRLHLRTTQLLGGEMRDAERDVTSAIAAFQSAGQVYLAMRAIEILGHVQRARGRLEAAQETYRWALEIANAREGTPPPSAGIAYAGMAEVAYWRDDLDEASRFASQAIRLCRSMAYRRPMAAAVATLARVRWAQGDPDGVEDAFAQDPHVASSVGVSSVLNPIPALRARLLLARGDVSATARWTDERGLGPDDDVSYPREAEYLLLARMLLAEGRLDQALALLQRLHALAERQGRSGSVLEIDALRAVALAEAGDVSSAVAALSEALALAQPEGYVRILVDEGPAMRALLVRHLAAQRDDETWSHPDRLAYLGKLMRAFESGETAETPAGGRGVGVTGLVEALSEREVEVLRLLAAGKSNQEIAEELFVALDTVKKHVSHILAKLGASNRTEATARARALGLLADRVGRRTAARR